MSIKEKKSFFEIKNAGVTTARNIKIKLVDVKQDNKTIFIEKIPSECRFYWTFTERRLGCSAFLYSY